jgi:hypothetical protein
MSTDSDSSAADSRERRQEKELQQIRDALRNLRFGSVNIIVQDGVIVQIDRTEKRRLRLPNSSIDKQS